MFRNQGSSPLVFGLVVLSLGCSLGCSGIAKLERLHGPEDPSVIGSLSGTILAEDSRGDIIRVALPSMARQLVPLETAGVRGLSNLGDAGEFVYAQYNRPWQLVLVPSTLQGAQSSPPRTVPPATTRSVPSH